MQIGDYDVDRAFWSRKYLDIVSNLGLDLHNDLEATHNAHKMFEPKRDEISELVELLGRKIAGRPIVIFGCGPSLDPQVRVLGTTLGGTGATLIAADGATSALLEAGMNPHVIVTDLDGYMPDIVSASKNGALIILHFHGDNREAVEKYLPLMGDVVPVTQNKPTSVIRNFGGFTDGDKCLFLAAAFGASVILLIGMDFGQVIGPRSNPGSKSEPRKLRKLAIGRCLCEEVIRRTNIRVFALPPKPFTGVDEINPDDVGDLLGGRHGDPGR